MPTTIDTAQARDALIDRLIGAMDGVAVPDGGGAHDPLAG